VSYFVDWKPTALVGLAAAWVAIPDRASVNHAESEITRLLTRDPYGVGAPVSEGLREITVLPLVAFYTINSSKHVVEVLRLGYFPPPSP